MNYCTSSTLSNHVISSSISFLHISNQTTSHIIDIISSLLTLPFNSYHLLISTCPNQFILPAPLPSLPFNSNHSINSLIHTYYTHYVVNVFDPLNHFNVFDPSHSLSKNLQTSKPPNSFTSSQTLNQASIKSFTSQAHRSTWYCVFTCCKTTNKAIQEHLYSTTC